MFREDLVTNSLGEMTRHMHHTAKTQPGTCLKVLWGAPPIGQGTTRSSDTVQNAWMLVSLKRGTLANERVLAQQGAEFLCVGVP